MRLRVDDAVDWVLSTRIPERRNADCGRRTSKNCVLNSGATKLTAVVSDRTSPRFTSRAATAIPSNTPRRLGDDLEASLDIQARRSSNGSRSESHCRWCCSRVVRPRWPCCPPWPARRIGASVLDCWPRVGRRRGGRDRHVEQVADRLARRRPSGLWRRASATSRRACLRARSPRRRRRGSLAAGEKLATGTLRRFWSEPAVGAGADLGLEI